MLDGYERNIDYARISLTDKCNLRCVYCMPEDKVYENNLINDTLSFNDYKFIINGLSQVGIKKIKFTGGEPLLYPHLIELIKYAHYECNIDDISITTNGIGLNEIAYELKRSGLKSVNISLDSLKSYKYKSITRGGNLTDVLKSINRCLELGIKVKINCVVIKRFNDDEVYDFIEMANYYPIDVRFIELMPIGIAVNYKAANSLPSASSFSSASESGSFMQIASSPPYTWAPASSMRATQLRIHSPSPHP